MYVSIHECIYLSINHHTDIENSIIDFKDRSITNCIYDKCKSVFEDQTNHLQENRPYHEILLMEDFKSFKKETGKKIAHLDHLLSRKRVLSPKNKQVKASTPLQSANSVTKNSFNLNKKIFQKEHSPNIFFRNNRVGVDRDVNEDFRFVFLNANLNNSSWKWNMRIVKLYGYIGLGVCYKEDIIEKNYRYVETLHHSSYVMCTDGNIWNCSNINENGIYLDNLRQIDEGDEITMNYCHIKKTLKLSYNKINITMSKVDSKILKTLTPCLIFQYPGDEIEIIELKQII